MPRDPRQLNKARNAELARIHATSKQLGLDDDTYRAMLREVAGASSAADLDAAGRRRVLDHLGKLGTPYKGKPKNMHKLPGEVDKIEALLADMGLAWAYADAIAQRMWGIPRMAWVRDQEKVRAILAALDAEHQKRSNLETIDRWLLQLGRDREWLELVLWKGAAPKGWERRRATLKAVVAWLAPQVPDKTEGASHG